MSLNSFISIYNKNILASERKKIKYIYGNLTIIKVIYVNTFFF